MAAGQLAAKAGAQGLGVGGASCRARVRDRSGRREDAMSGYEEPRQYDIVCTVSTTCSTACLDYVMCVLNDIELAYCMEISDPRVLCASTMRHFKRLFTSCNRC